MKVLVTGFDPFGGEKVNPAYEAVKLLPETISGADIIKLEIPTVFSKCGHIVEEAVKVYSPDVVICVGQAGGRTGISIEKTAINLAEARIPDNEGAQPIEESIREDGDTAYFSTLPVKAMAENIRRHGIQAGISYSAGTFVCNYIMYQVLYLADKKYRGIRAGFIHVPYSTEQAALKPEGTPGMSLEDIAGGLEYAIEAVIEEKKYKCYNMQDGKLN
ncbi:pyroglutamyl-peptidase I [Murimonas intestini]|uniref:pyroglutamyl-peptidase I n=1 Tax=Murimonas intestini TaxID=1337051 RepID=UPI0011DD6936|nr:pyroglutamyl-peptidase I [Murimonas intestini]